MAKMTKRRQAIMEKVDTEKTYDMQEAFELLKQTSNVKFTESVDAAIKLGVDARKSDQVVRGSTVLPNGTGKTVRVAVFAQGANAEKAMEAGADIVGFDDLAEKVQAGEMDFDVVIATPDAMRVVGKLGQILGPRGLMPNPKVGTVTPDVETAVKKAKGGQVRYRIDKGGIIHAPIGNVDFDAKALEENLKALINDLVKSKPPAAKGRFLQKVSVSTTMGPGLLVDASGLGLI